MEMNRLLTNSFFFFGLGGNDGNNVILVTRVDLTETSAPEKQESSFCAC